MVCLLMWWTHEPTGGPTVNARLPATDPCLGTAATLVHAAHRISTHHLPADALGEMATTVREAGAGIHVALLLRDPAAGAWHLTLLVDPAGRIAPLAGLGVPSGPLELALAPVRAIAPLSSVFGPAWGVAGCALAAQRLAAEQVLSVPLSGGAGTPQGMVMAFVPASAGSVTSVVAALLLHAAAATARHLRAAPAGSGDGLLTAEALTSAATREVERAVRFGRPLAVVAVELPRVAEIARTGTALAGMLSPWDVAGRLDGDRPRLAVVLPDASRGETRRVIDGVLSSAPGARVAAAWLGEDGRSFARLAMVALGRTGLGQPPAAAGAATSTAGNPALFTWSSRPSDGPLTWRRGLPMGSGAETVRCPRCLAPYSLRGAGALPAAALEQALAAARASLHASCPRHTEELRTAA